MQSLLPFNIIAARRLVCLMLAALLFVATLPMLEPAHAGAAQMTNRSIKLTDSAPSGSSITTGVGSGNNVTYRVSFTASSASAQSLIIDFCAETPLINAVCTRPTGFANGSAALVAVSGQVGTGWTLDASNTGQLKLTSDGSHPITPGAQVFDITGITNPSTVGSFFARIYTYSDVSYGSTSTAYVSPANAGNYADFGGIAMSTVNVITITARVQEQLTFCLTKAVNTSWNSCSDAVVGQASNRPALILGHTQNGIEVLDSSAVDYQTIYSQISTNAINGAVIRLRNSNTACGGLSSDSGSTCSIPPVNSGSTTPAAIAAGTAAFGLFVASGAQTGTVGSLTDSANYHNPAHVTVPSDVYYGMEYAAGNVTGVGSTFGSTLSSTVNPCYEVDTAYTFAATAALTTPAGIYAANLSMIATGTF